jgi:hypothetical protein
MTRQTLLENSTDSPPPPSTSTRFQVMAFPYGASQAKLLLFRILLSSIEAQNEWSYTSTLPLCLYDVYRHFTFTFTPTLHQFSIFTFGRGILKRHSHEITMTRNVHYGRDDWQ